MGTDKIILTGNAFYERIEDIRPELQTLRDALLRIDGMEESGRFSSSLRKSAEHINSFIELRNQPQFDSNQPLSIDTRKAIVNHANTITVAFNLLKQVSRTRMTIQIQRTGDWSKSEDLMKDVVSQHQSIDDQFDRQNEAKQSMDRGIEAGESLHTKLDALKKECHLSIADMIGLTSLFGHQKQKG